MVSSSSKQTSILKLSTSSFPFFPHFQPLSYIKLSTKLLIYKLYLKRLKPMWTYGIKVGSCKNLKHKPYSTLSLLSIQNPLCFITKAPFYASIQILHNDLTILPVYGVAKIFYRRFNLNVQNHCLLPHQSPKDLRQKLYQATPRERLKRRWCRELY